MKINAIVTIDYTDFDFKDNQISALAFAEDAARYCTEVDNTKVVITYMREDRNHEGSN